MLVSNFWTGESTAFRHAELAAEGKARRFLRWRRRRAQKGITVARNSVRDLVRAAQRVINANGDRKNSERAGLVKRAEPHGYDSEQCCDAESHLDN